MTTYRFLTLKNVQAKNEAVSSLNSFSETVGALDLRISWPETKSQNLCT